MAIFSHYLSERKEQCSDIRLGIKVIKKSNQKETLINSNEVEKYLFYILNQFQMHILHIYGHRVRRFCLALGSVSHTEYYPCNCTFENCSVLSDTTGNLFRRETKNRQTCQITQYC